MADRLVALPGLLTASWRGIRFAVYDVTTPAGRRLMSIDLPGADVTIHEDLGIANGPIRVTGVIIGDDYTAQAWQLESAFNQPGPGTLVHPWLGARTCILSTEGAEIRFEPSFLRGLKFQATFLRWQPTAGAAVSTLAAISTAAGALETAMTSVLVMADALIGGEIAEVTASTWSVMRATLDLTPAGASLITVAGSTRIEGVLVASAAGAVPDAAGAEVWIETTCGALASAGVPPASPAIGVGPTGRAAEATVDSYATTRAMLAIAVALADAAVEEDAEGRSLAVIAAALGSLVAMVAPLAAVDWESRQQAEGARAEISAAIGAVATAIITSVDGSADAAAVRQAAWRALGDLRRRIHEDLDQRIGRLPSVLTIEPPTRVNAWVVAQYVAGDDPKAVQSAFEDIVSRNGLAHPSVIGTDAVEVLPPKARTGTWP